MKTIWQVFGLTCIVSLASAQTAPIRSGSFELGAFVGSTYNVSQGAIMGGANISYAVTKIFLPYVEYSYFPSIERNLTQSFLSLQTSYPTHAVDYHVGVHIRIPIRETRLAPYGVFGIGGLGVGAGTVNGYTFVAAGQSEINGCFGGLPKGCPNKDNPNLGISIPGGSTVAVNFGGGLRYYVTPRYGFRVEVKGYKPLSNQQSSTGYAGLNSSAVTITNTFLKAEAGFFIQFR